MSDFNPRVENDNLGTICAWHRRYNFNDPGVETGYNGLFWVEAPGIRLHSPSTTSLEKILSANGLLLPLYLYDHSVQMLSTESFIGRAQHAEWDSGRVGFIFVTNEKLRSEYGCERVTKKVRDTATRVLKAEVEEYSNYLNGWDEEESDGEEE